MQIIIAVENSRLLYRKHMKLKFYELQSYYIWISNISKLSYSYFEHSKVMFENATILSSTKF